MRKSVNVIVVFFLFLFFFVPSVCAQPQQNDPICAIYITGIGCSNCAITDPILFKEYTRKYKKFIVFEYEIYKSNKENKVVTDVYFASYLPGGRSGVPLLIFDKDTTFIGRFNVPKGESEIRTREKNDFPLPDGQAISFAAVDLTTLSGKVNIWTKDRVLISGKGGNNDELKRLLLADDLPVALATIVFKRSDPIPVEISQGEVVFENAVTLAGGWRLQWNGETVGAVGGHMRKNPYQGLLWIFAVSALCALIRVEAKDGSIILSRQKDAKQQLNIFLAGMGVMAIAAFFVFARSIHPDAIQKAGYALPLPVFTFIIGLIDGFNPCNMFVLTCLLTLLVATSDSHLRVSLVGISFIGTSFLFYFLFMAAWFNVFNYIGFIEPLRVGIAIVALVAGVINCKELFFFKRGISLMIPEGQQKPLMDRITRMRTVIQTGSIPMLLLSSITLATLASLVELPCTAGLPIIFTSILSAKGFAQSWGHYVYIFFYNVAYIVPLLVIFFFFLFTFRAHRITQRQVEVIKFIAGIIMIILAILLLVNPSLVGISK